MNISTHSMTRWWAKSTQQDKMNNISTAWQGDEQNQHITTRWWAASAQQDKTMSNINTSWQDDEQHPNSMTRWVTSAQQDNKMMSRVGGRLKNKEEEVSDRLKSHCPHRKTETTRHVFVLWNHASYTLRVPVGWSVKLFNTPRFYAVAHSLLDGYILYIGGPSC